MFAAVEVLSVAVLVVPAVSAAVVVGTDVDGVVE